MSVSHTSLADRIGRLTPRELRVLLLLADELSAEDIGLTSGLNAQQVAGIRQSLRRKLAVPPGQQLTVFVRQMPDLVAMARSTATGPPPERPTRAVPVERRSKLLLRKTIQELEELMGRVESRATALDALRESASEDAVGQEIELLQSMHTDLSAARAAILDRARNTPFVA